MSPAMNAVFATDAQRWNAVVNRDDGANGAFICAVKTTGIYCHPSCPSRRPKRGNVVFFADWQAAEQAGYRACRKCKPRDLPSTSQAPAAVARACTFIDQAETPPSLNDLAQAVGLSPYHLHRLFKRTLGITPKAYAAQRRTRRLKDGLRRDQTVTSAIYAAGFNSTSRCYETVSQALGMTPARYKNGAAGLRIRYAVKPSYLGWLLVAATDRGICTIELGDAPRVMRKRLAVRFAKAELVDDDPAFAAWVTQVLALIEAPGRRLDLPLDIQGTAFQRRVWEALRAIPAGTTTTYAAIAKRIGRPRAVRAVGNACAANPVAVVVPCHRVLRGNGGLGGYRWGLKRKQALLDRELCAGTGNP